MTAVALASELRSSKVFRHEALFYAGEEAFMEAVTRFVTDGVRAGEPVMVAVPRPSVDRLRARLGKEAIGVRFEDMAEAGRNPGRIISLWSDFAAEHPTAKQLRGVGEPIWADRKPEETAECEQHEALLNLAFAGAPMWLICPYDTSTLGWRLLDRAADTHGRVAGDWPLSRRRSIRSGPSAPDLLDGPLPDPPGDSVRLTFDRHGLGTLRSVLMKVAAEYGLGKDPSDALVLAVNEVATNSVRYGGGKGELRAWRGPWSVVCEVRDQGFIEDPLAGRFRPKPIREKGFGLWLANQLCDLVQIRSNHQGSVIRVHARLE